MGMTYYEWMTSCGPSKLATFLRKKLASNQGCPPASLTQVFTMCHESGSCDQCWWTWLCSEMVGKELPEERDVKVIRCWDCKWGARGEGRHPFVGCLHPKFYGAVMDMDDFCCFSEQRYKTGKEQHTLETASRVLERAGKLSEEEAKELDAYVKEERRKEELKLLKAEIERRAQKPEEVPADTEKTTEGE